MKLFILFSLIFVGHVTFCMEREARIKELQAIVDTQKEKLKQFEKEELLIKSSKHHDLHSCEILSEYAYNLCRNITTNNPAQLKKEQEKFKALMALVTTVRKINTIENSH